MTTRLEESEVEPLSRPTTTSCSVVDAETFAETSIAKDGSSTWPCNWHYRRRNVLFAIAASFLFGLSLDPTSSSSSGMNKITTEIQAIEKSTIHNKHNSILNDDDVMTTMTRFVQMKQSRSFPPTPWDTGFVSCQESYPIAANKNDTAAIQSTYAGMSALDQRRVAEHFWLTQSGLVYLQHSRKAGGTTMCMQLRLNRAGLIQLHGDSDWKGGSRVTCQITQLCPDCSYKTRPGYVGMESAPTLLECAMRAAGRNFIEVEADSSPPDIMTNPEWANYVFVSSIRHPIARAVSSLRHDPRFTLPQPACTHPTDAKALSNCARGQIASEDAVLGSCQHGIYYCFSNYYVRMFAGMDDQQQQQQRTVTREALATAKRNFGRYSCVILLESWDETSHCMSKIGLHLTDARRFNVDGTMTMMEDSDGTTTAATRAELNFTASLSDTELSRLEELNDLDLEFYNWAANQILSGAFR